MRIPALAPTLWFWVIALGVSPAAQADVVEATFRIQATQFEDSALMPPMAPTSDSIDALVSLTFNSAIFEQENLALNAISGLEIDANDGATNSYDLTNAGFNFRRFAADNKIRIAVGGLQSTVAFMGGLSNDFRVGFELSLTDFSLLEVNDNFVFVTPADPFYTAQNTIITILDMTVFPDSDEDTLIDSQDNCVEAANTDQRDTDADGIGNRCDADFNQDCVVNFLDLGVMRAQFFTTGDLDTDLDGDGNVNFTDLGILRSLFFAPPGPSGVANVCALRALAPPNARAK